MKPGTFPQGWDEGCVHEVLAQCAAHTEDEAVAEDEAAFENQSQRFMEIPNARVPNMNSPLRAQRISCSTPRHVVRMAFLMLAVAASPVPVFGLNITVTNLTPPTADAGSANAVNGTWQGGSITIAAVNYPALWSGSAASYIDLTPAGATGGNVYAVSGSELGGTAIVGGHTHAALWSGSAHTYTDLHPVGTLKSFVNALTATQQGGVVFLSADVRRAALWSGTSSYVDLTPAGASQSDLNAMHGAIQAGSAFMDLPGATKDHAALWSGTAESFVDLHPAGASSSSIYGYDGLHQVGYATVDGYAHAGLWSGTAESFIDLNGTNNYSWAFGVAGSWQVGQFFAGPNAQAGLWNGTPESLINLTPYLGAEYNSAQAFGAWLDGTSLYIVGTASGPAENYQAVLWTVVVIPEPGPMFQIAAAAALFAIVARWKKGSKIGHSRT